VAIHVIQDEEKQSKNTTQYVLDITMLKQTQIRHELSCKLLEVKTNRASLSCGNRYLHYNTELRTLRHIIGQRKKQRKLSNTDPTQKFLIFTIKLSFSLFLQLSSQTVSCSNIITFGYSQIVIQKKFPLYVPRVQ
jgi:hypothetical protein